MLKLAFLSLTNFSNFPTPSHSFKEFLLPLFSRKKLWRVIIPIPWVPVSGYGYFINYRVVVILRDNLEMVIILNREEIDGMDY